MCSSAFPIGAWAKVGRRCWATVPPMRLKMSRPHFVRISRCWRPSTAMASCQSSMSRPTAAWGDRRYRWRGRGGLLHIRRDAQALPRFDLAMKDKEGETSQEFPAVPREKLTDAWLNLICVPRPRTGIEVVSTIADEDGEQRFVFRNLRTGEVSNAPWRLQDIEEARCGSTRRA